MARKSLRMICSMEHLLRDQKGASSPSMPKFRAFQIKDVRYQKVVFVALVISEFEQKERGKIGYYNLITRALGSLFLVIEAISPSSQKTNSDKEGFILKRKACS